MAKKRRASAQRERIYSLIRENNNHPTALWLFDHLKNEFPALSLGNLYRNLNILMEENRIRARIFRDGVEHFDAVLKRHHHFICDQCTGITDIMIPLDENIVEVIQRKTSHTVNSHTIQFYGICNKCKKE